jgi:hypothetical protein
MEQRLEVPLNAELLGIRVIETRRRSVRRRANRYILDRSVPEVFTHWLLLT